MSRESTRTETVLSLVERGWPGARRLAIQLTRRGIRVHHLVRGRLPPDVLAVLTPYEGMTIKGVSPRWYRWWVWGKLARLAMGRRPVMIVVDHERAAAWVARWFPAWRARTVLIRDTPEGLPVVLQDGAPVDINALVAQGRR